VYFGTLVEADYALSGRVVDSDISPVLGFSVFGCGPQFKFDVSGAASGSMTLDPYKLWKAYTDPIGYIIEGALPPASSEIGKISFNPPAATFSWEQHVALRDDLTFGALQQTFSISLDARNLFEVTLPKFISPTPIPFVDLAVTPHFGFGPYVTASWTTTQSGGTPQVSDSSISAGVEVSLGASAELEVLLGLGTVGLDGTVTGDIGFEASRTGSGPWSYGIPASLSIDLDAIGSLGWHAWEGRFNLAHFSVSTDLLNGGGSPATANAGALTSGATSGTDPTILSRSIARSAAGDMAIAWSQVDLGGTAQPLLAQRRTAAGAWGLVETVASSNHFRGDPALAYLPDGRLMVLWSESTLDASTVPGMDGESVSAGQEIYWSVRDAGGWTAPQALTSDGLLDDQPALAARPDGTVMAVWRHASAVDLSNPSVMDLLYATYDGTNWSAPATLINDAVANGRPTLTVSGAGDVVASWLSSTAFTGEEAAVRSSVFHAGAWSSAIAISDTTGDLRQSPRLVCLPDSRVLAFWTEEGEDGRTMRMAIRDPASGNWSASYQVLPGQQWIGSPMITAYGTRVDVVWHGIGGTKSSVFSVSRDFGNDQGWSAPLDLTPGTGQNWWPMPGADATGNLGLAYVADPSRGSSLLTAIDGATMLGSASAGSFSANIQMLSIAKLPDLVVKSTDLSLASVPAAPGQPNVVRVQVSDEGLSASPVASVALYDGDPAAGGMLIGTQPLTALGIGGTATVNFTWVPTAGMHNLWAVVDPTHSVSELSTTNNQATAAFAVVAAPTLTLDPASDTGTAGDGRTADTTPTINGSAPCASSVALFVDSQSSSVSQATVTGGAYSATLPPLTNGQHTIWAQAYDEDGSPSPFSAPLVLLIDAAALPTPASPQLDPASDTGTVGDGITACLRPTMLGQAKPLARVRLLDGGMFLGEVDASALGQYQFTPSEDLEEGVHLLTAVQADEAGNESDPSAAFALTIDPTQVWVGGVNDHWEQSPNWSPDLEPGPHTPAVFDATSSNQPALHQDESAKGVDFRSAGWTLGGSGYTLNVGSGGIDSAGAGTNTVDPGVLLDADSTWTVGGDNTLVLNGALGGGNNRLTKDGTGVLVLNGGQDRTTGLSLNTSGGTVRLGGGQVLALDSLAFGGSPTATLDVTTGALAIDYTGVANPFANVQEWIRAAYDANNWDLPGITSSSLKAGGGLDPLKYAIGYADNQMLPAKYNDLPYGDPNQHWFGTANDKQPVAIQSVLVKTTYIGDVNLDGKVDDNDVTIMVLNYDRGLVSTHTWQEGDVSRYDGKVDDNDVTLLVLNYGAGWKPGRGAPLGGAPVAAALPAAAPEVLMTPDAIPSAPLVEDADLVVYAQATRARQTALGLAQAAGGAGVAPTMVLARSGPCQGSAFLPGSGTSASDDPPLVFLAATSTPLAWSTAQEAAPTPGAALSPDVGVEDLLLVPALEVPTR
jgi:hypothetical protein